MEKEYCISGENAVTFKADVEEIKSEDIEGFEDTSQAIIFATQAVEQAVESVKKVKKNVDALICLDETTGFLNLAIKYCQDAEKAFTESASVWQEIQKQTLTPADITADIKEDDHSLTNAYGDVDNNVKKELNEEAYFEDLNNFDKYDDNNDEIDKFDELDNEENDPDYTEHLEKNDAVAVKGEINDYEELVVDEDSDLKQEYDCKLCEYTTNKRRNFVYHSFRTHKMVVKKKNIDQSFREKKYPCTLCTTSFTAEENLRKHAIKIHSETVFKCLTCKEMFIGNGEEKLKDHMTEKHPDVAWKPPRKMVKYYNQFYKEIEGIIECLLCDYKTNKEMKKSPYDKIRLHVKRHITPKKRMQCSECDYVLELRADGVKTYMQEHIDSVHKGISYPCPEEGCTHRSKQKRNIKKHVDTVHAKADLACKKCEFTTKFDNHLRIHIREEHTSSNEKAYCDQCTFAGHNRASLNVHRVKIHGANRASGGTIDPVVYPKGAFKYGMSRRDFKCPSCPFNTLHHSALSNHVRNKHENHNMMCDKCDFTTYTKLSFKRHIEKEHSDKLLSCDSCEFTTKTNEQLKKHNRKHTGLTFTCEYDGCVSIFNFKSDYRIHVNAVHKKIRHYCPECEFSAARKGDLNRHVNKTHASETDKPLKCFRCLFTTSLKSFLIDHITETHEQDDLLKLEEMTTEDFQKI